MKTEVEVDGRIFRVGDIIENPSYPDLLDQKILCIDNGSFFARVGDESYSQSISSLKYFKHKKKTKTVEIDFWVNVYEYGSPHTHESRRAADSAKAITYNRLDCINIKKSYEVEVEE